MSVPLVRKPRRHRVQKSQVAEMRKTTQKQPKARARLSRSMAQGLRSQNLLQTVSWSSWIRNGRNVSVNWRLCFCQRRLPSQNRFSSQWSSLQPSLHQPVLLITLSPSFSLNRPTDQPPLTSNRPTDWPLLSSSLLTASILITGLLSLLRSRASTVAITGCL